MRKLVLLILLLAFAMQGCKKLDPMTDLDSVIVSSEEFIAEAEDFGPQTKTSLATSRKVVWSEDDQIAIFQGSSLADRFQVSDESVGNSNGVFSFVGNAGVENGDYSAGTETTLETNVALYPYQDGIECSAITDEEDVVTSYAITGVTIPANQIYAEDSFAEESFIMAAVTEGLMDHNLKFKNVCGAIKLQLKGERTIKSISVSGKGDEVIAGEGVVTVYPDGAAPSVLMDESGEKVITLDCSEDGGVELNQEEVTVFVIAVPPTPFENGFTVTITDDEDNIETFSASAGTSVERSVITVMTEIDLLTSAYLPDGETFNSSVDAFMTGKEITEIKFITNSATTSQDALVDGSIYLVQNGQTLEIHTAAGQYMANSDCRSMFYAYEGYDDSAHQAILNSFGQIQVIDFGKNFNTQNVTDMGSMFERCSSLTSLDVSNFKTQNVKYMFMMFKGCTSLTLLDLSNFDTQNVTNMSSMFNGCTSLTLLDVSKFDTRNVTDMGYMFLNCTSLTSLDVSSFDTQNVTDMSSMFWNCRSLTSLDVSNFDTKNVTYMYYMFSGCSGLTSLDLSKFDTQNVTHMSDMFSHCSNLTTLDISKFDTQKVTDMGQMFYGCSSLTSLDVSNFKTQNVIDMCNMFRECSSLTSLDLSNFETQNVTSMGSMFLVCSSLTSLNLSKFDTQNVTNMGGMFRDCTGLTSLDVSKFDTRNVTAMGQMFYYCTNLTSLDLSNFTFESNPDIEDMFSSIGSNATNKPIPIYVSAEGKDYIETKGNSYINSNDAILTDKETFKERAYLPDGGTFNSTVDAFMTGKGITGIKFITNSATTSEDALVDGSIYLVQNGETLEIHTAAGQFMANSSCSYMFAGESYDHNLSKYVDRTFKQIQTIDFGDNFNTQNVTDMGYMFHRCTSLTSLDVSNFDTQNVTGMGHMFYSCRSLTSLDASNFDTQNVTYMYGMFYNCSRLTSLDLSNFDTQNVTSMSYMFECCTSLTSLDVSNFDTQNVTGMRYMFKDCTSLTSLDVSNFDTQNVTDMGWMFEGCSSLTSLDLSDFDTQNVTDMGWMFEGCSSLTSLDVSKFTFEGNPNIEWMFSSTGSNATNRPIPIYVSAEGKSYIETKGNSYISSSYATLTIKAPQTE